MTEIRIRRMAVLVNWTLENWNLFGAWDLVIWI
jgi:hypothetical protein